jgi:carbamoyl-phosphate synthase large subunit
MAPTIHEALLLGMMSTGFRRPRAGVLLSLGPTSEKFSFSDEARVIRDELELPIFATVGTASMLNEIGVACTPVDKGVGDGATAIDLIGSGKVDLVINIPREYDSIGRPDGYLIRRATIDSGVPLLTDLQLARAVIEALRHVPAEGPAARPWSDFISTEPVPR